MSQASLPLPERNLPVHTFRHRNLKAVIWRNFSEKGSFYTVTVSRSYRDGETWKESHSFGYDEIMNVAKLLSDAHSFITELRAGERQKPIKKPPARSRKSEKPT